MTTWYVDPIGGNDANAGTSFATRCKSLTGISAKSILAGETVRIIESPAAVAVAGQGATLWTDGSKTVTLSTAVTATITQSTAAWTAVGANVTTTTSTIRKLGATSASIAVAAAFTTGLAAYFPTGTLDLSGYQQVSFWIYLSAGVTLADGDISLALCSDTAGATVVNSISIPWIKATAGWNCFTVNTGAALGSSIQSIGLYVNQDRAAQTFLINSIIACKASSATDSITLSSLISPADTASQAWWAIESIVGTTISLAQEPNYNLSAAQSAQGFAGPGADTATYTGLYKREPIVLPSSLIDSTSLGVNWATFSKGGTTSSVVQLSGGWNATDMSTLTGATFIASYNGLGIGFSPSATNIAVNNLNFTRFQYGIYFGSSTISSITYNAHTVCSCAFGFNVGQSQAGSGTQIGIYNIVQCNYGFYANNAGLTSLTMYSWNISGNANQGVQLTRAISTSVAASLDHADITIFNIRRNGQTASGSPGFLTATGAIFAGVTNSRIMLSNIDRNYGGNLQLGLTNNAATLNNQIYFQSTTTNSMTVGANYANIQFIDGANNTIKLTDFASPVGSPATISLTGGTYAIVAVGNGYNNTIIGGRIAGSTAAIFAAGSARTMLQNTTLISGTIYTTNSPSTGKDYPITTWQNYNGSATDHRIFYNNYSTTSFNGQITTDATIRHTASGFSWKITGGNTYDNTFTHEIELPVGQFAIKDVGTTYNISIWTYPTNGSSSMKLRVYYSSSHNVLVGGANYVETIASSSTANTWVQTTLILTVPASATPGVYSASVIASNLTDAAPRSLYVDDFSVSQ